MEQKDKVMPKPQQQAIETAGYFYGMVIPDEDLKRRRPIQDFKAGAEWQYRYLAPEMEAMRKALEEIADKVLEYNKTSGDNPAANHCRNIALEALAKSKPTPLSQEIGEGGGIPADVMEWVEQTRDKMWKGAPSENWGRTLMVNIAIAMYHKMQLEISLANESIAELTNERDEYKGWYNSAQANVSALTEEAHTYRSALQEIEDPTSFIQSRADAEGKPMDGQRALKLSFDPVYLRGIATLAMKQFLK